MRSIFFILILVCCVSISWAQDSVRHERQGIISTLREKLRTSPSKLFHSNDSLKHKPSGDTLNVPADSSKHSKWNARAKQKYDSIQQVFEIQNKVTHGTDSVINAATNPVNTLENSVDNLQQKTDNHLQGKVDSMKQKLNNPLDNINTRLSSIEKPIDQKVDGVNKAIEKQTDKLQAGIQKGFDKATDGTVKAPVEGLNADDINLPAEPGSVPTLDVSNPNIPGLDTDLIDADSPLDLPDTKLNMDQLKEKADLKIPEVNKLNDAKGEMGKVNSQLDKAEKYENELRGLKNLDSASVENVSQKAEEKIMNLEQMKGVKEQTQVLTKQQAEYNALMQRYKDKKLLQQEITRKAKGVINEKINQNTPEVKEGMTALDKHKKSLKELLSKKNNSMAGKPIGQRLIPGINLQSYNRDVFMIDFGLQVGYRFSGRLRAGVGGVYRTGFSKSYPAFVKGLNIYGGRTYTEFLIRKGIYVHAEYELLNATYSLTQNPEEKQYISAGYFGLGKQFNISKKIKGHTMALYRAEFSGKLLDQSKVNVRFGFDLRTEKKRKKDRSIL